MITAEQFEEWKAHPVTIEIYEELKAVKESISSQLAVGSTIGIDAQATHSLTSRAVGHLEGINQLLNISYDQGTDADDMTDKSRY